MDLRSHRKGVGGSASLTKDREDKGEGWGLWLKVAHGGIKVEGVFGGSEGGGVEERRE